MKSGFESAACSECTFPPNHLISQIPFKDKRIIRYSVKCKDCNDSWEENFIKEDS